MWYVALFAACVTIALISVLGGVWLLRKIADSSADYMPHDWDFETNKEAEIQ